MDPNTPAATAEVLSGADAFPEGADELGALVQGLNELDEEQRIVVALHYLEGLTAGDIARVMDMEEPAVEQTFADAITRLRVGAAERGTRAA